MTIFSNGTGNRTVASKSVWVIGTEAGYVWEIVIAEEDERRTEFSIHPASQPVDALA